MIRFILNLSPRDHIGQIILDTVKLLDTQNRARQLRLNHMFNIFHSLGPPYLSQFFTKISDVYSHTTRSSALSFHVPRVGSYYQKVLLLSSHTWFEQFTIPHQINSWQMYL